MLTGEVYIGQDGNVYKKIHFEETVCFLRFKDLSQQEINQLTDLPNNTKIKSHGGSTGDQATEPTTGIGARTDTRDPVPTPAGTNAVDGIYGGDFLH